MSERNEGDLAGRTCRPCEGGTPPLSTEEMTAYLDRTEGWAFAEDHIERTFTFRNFHETMAFVNAVAWIAHTQDHHPDLEVGYKTCRVSYTTHSIGGLSENDFICAAKVNRLFDRDRSGVD